MTNGIVLVPESDGDCAVRLLHDRVQVAVHGMMRTACDLASVNAALATLTGEVEPVFPQLQALADAQPAGPVAAALFHLRSAFGHAAAGHPESAVSSMVTAAAMTGQFDPADTESDDIGLWR